MKEHYREIAAFVEKHENDDPIRLRLSKEFNKSKTLLDIDFALLQIDCRKRDRKRLPNLLANPFFLYPDSLSRQQASSEATAAFHASLIAPSESVLDMTSGLGVDSLAIARKCHKLLAIDLDKRRCDTLLHNSEVFHISNIEVCCEDSSVFLKNTTLNFDTIFIDPSRRDQDLNRVYGFKDCSPDVMEIENLLLNKSKRVLIKASPMLDITQTIRDLKYLSVIYSVSVKGECKEILIELKKELSPDNLITGKAIDLDNVGKKIFEFDLTFPREHEKNHDSLLRYCSPDQIKEGKFILEPSPTVMKFSPWEEICDRFDAFKLAPSSNLFVTEHLPDNFPGRVKRVKQIITKKESGKLKDTKATIVSRNYPVSADELRKKLKIKEGDSQFLYATRIGNTPIMILADSFRIDIP